MKKLARLLPLAAIAAASVMVPPLRADITITLSDASNPALVPPMTTVCGPVAGNVLTCSTSDGDYTIQVDTASDNSPGGPAQQGNTLQVTSTAGAVGNPLTIKIGSTNFMLPVGLGALTESVTANNPAPTVFGTITGQGYVSLTNTALDISGPTSGPAEVSCVSIGALGCGTGGSFLGTAEAVGPPGGVTFASPFALNQVLTLTVTTPGIENFTTDLDATVPEPMSIALLGGVLLLTTGAIRRKRNQVSRS
jgi:hypothetical protein